MQVAGRESLVVNIWVILRLSFHLGKYKSPVARSVNRRGYASLNTNPPSPKPTVYMRSGSLWLHVCGTNGGTGVLVGVADGVGVMVAVMEGTIVGTAVGSAVGLIAGVQAASNNRERVRAFMRSPCSRKDTARSRLGIMRPYVLGTGFPP